MTDCFVLGRFTLGVGLCMALLGCGGAAQVPQLPSNGTAQAVPLEGQGFNRGKSWMSSRWLNELHNPHHKKQKLLYLDVYRKGGHAVDILDYRTGALIGRVYWGFYGGSNLCSDRKGNVYAASWKSGGFEIQAGTTKVIKTFDMLGNPDGCAVSKSGDVAFSIVDNGHEGCSGSGVEVYRGGDRHGTFYPGPEDCNMPAAYDDKGNLFISDSKLWELPAGGSSWIALRSNRSISSGPLEWDGKYLALLEPYRSCVTPKNPTRGCMDQIAVSGNRYTVVNRIHLLDSSCRVELLSGWAENAKNPNGQTTSPATEIVAGNDGCYPLPIRVWTYPAGGAPKRTISLSQDAPAGAATIVVI